MKRTSKHIDEAFVAMFTNIEHAKEYCFYAYLLGQCEIKEDPEFQFVAAVAFKTDHYDLIINPGKFSKISVMQRVGILKHEALHILEGHCTHRYPKNGNHKAWNLGTDCAINQLIDLDHLPPGVITPRYLEKQIRKTKKGFKVKLKESAEFYYNLFLNLTDEEKENLKEFTDFDNLTEPDEFQVQPEFAKTITKSMIDSAAEDTLKTVGKLPNQISKWLEIHKQKKPELNWKRVLRNVISSHRASHRKTIFRRNRRFQSRNDIKGKSKNKIMSFLVVLDISGSMLDGAIQKTLSETIAMFNDLSVQARMIQVDVHPFPSEVLSTNIRSINRKGAGGTFLSSALEQAESENLTYDVLLVITDGHLFEQDKENFKNVKSKCVYLVIGDKIELKESL